jgi:hypothetical protein
MGQEVDADAFGGLPEYRRGRQLDRDLPPALNNDLDMSIHARPVRGVRGKLDGKKKKRQTARDA